MHENMEKDVEVTTIWSLSLRNSLVTLEVRETVIVIETEKDLTERRAKLELKHFSRQDLVDICEGG